MHQEITYTVATNVIDPPTQNDCTREHQVKSLCI